MKITFLGHNAWYLDLDGVHVLIDPYLRGNPGCPADFARIPADYILVSHGHGDHFGDTLPIALRTGAEVVAIAEIAGYVEKYGVKRTCGMNLGGGVEFPFGRVTLTPARHSSTLPDGTPGGTAAGFLLRLRDGSRLYFACDTALFGDMALLGKAGIDVAFLPIGDRYTMGPDDALEAVRLLAPKSVVPCHYNTWPIIAQDAEAWKARVEAGTDAMVRILRPGESL